MNNIPKSQQKSLLLTNKTINNNFIKLIASRRRKLLYSSLIKKLFLTRKQRLIIRISKKYSSIVKIRELTYKAQPLIFLPKKKPIDMINIQEDLFSKRENEKKKIKNKKEVKKVLYSKIPVSLLPSFKFKNRTILKYFHYIDNEKIILNSALYGLAEGPSTILNNVLITSESMKKNKQFNSGIKEIDSIDLNLKNLETVNNSPLKIMEKPNNILSTQNLTLKNSLKGAAKPEENVSKLIKEGSNTFFLNKEIAPSSPQLTTSSSKKNNLNIYHNNKNLYNISSLKLINSEAAFKASDFSNESLYLNKNFNLLISQSQTKEMQDKVLKNFPSYLTNDKEDKTLNIKDANLNRLSGFAAEDIRNKKIYYKDILASLSYDRNIIKSLTDSPFSPILQTKKDHVTNNYNLDPSVAKPAKPESEPLNTNNNYISSVYLDRNINSKEKKLGLSSQPNIILNHYNYLTYPYKKRVTYPSLLSTYFSWKDGNSVYGILKALFEKMACLISKPYYYDQPNNLTIELFYYPLS